MGVGLAQRGGRGGACLPCPSLTTPSHPLQPPKDPNHPKRARSSYQLWVNDKGPEVRAANPNESIGGISRLLGQIWKEVGA